ncbi:MAG: acyl-CoA dehydrogenase family protein [Myxococcota bacterium]|nr:acyl-CoA dehydrogenase family protein [Myxococcota bacterium]
MSFFSNFISEEYELLRDTATKFARTEIWPNAMEYEEEGIFPIELYKKAGNAGILRAGFSEHVGGTGTNPMHQVMVTEGLMRGGTTGVVVGLGTAAIALPPILAAGTSGQIDKFVKPVLAGDAIAALAITEPNTGSDVAGVQTRAHKVEGGYRVSGNKLYISSGSRADFITTLVRTSDDPHGGLTFLVLEKPMKGLTVSRCLKKTGWWSSDTAELAFDDIFVPEENRIGSEGSGFILLMHNFQAERLALATYGATTAEIAYEEARRYATERNAFGKKIMGFQVTRHKLADMATQVTAAKTMVYQVGTRMAEGQEVVAEVSMAKNFCSDVALNVTREAVQIFGGMGYMRESWVERLSRDARLLPIGGGTQEIMKEIIGKRLNY